MKNRKIRSTPHNNYFVAVASIPAVALQLLQVGLTPEEYALLDFGKFSVSPNSFIDNKLKNNLSDIVYSCGLKNGGSLRICTLIEHKSTLPGSSLVLQLLRYILNILEFDRKQKNKHHTLTIPIVYYHGKENWQPKTLIDLYGIIPNDLKCYVPNFDFRVIDLQAMTDPQIMAMQKTLYVRNIFLAMKHAWEDKFYQHNFAEVVIFEAGKEGKEITDLLIQLTLEYIAQVSSLQKEEIMEAVQSLPTSKQKRIITTFDNFKKEGKIEGKIEGLKEGLELAIKKYLIARPLETDQQVAALFDVETSTINKIRKTITP